jgi:hypothetical protein
METILDYVMPMRLEQSNLGCGRLILAARLLVEIVRY